MAETLLDGLGFWVQKQLVLNQFPRESWHVGMLQCRDVPIFLEELDKREFLFGVQTIAYMTHLGRFLRGQRDRLAECVLRLDGRLGSLGLGHDRVRGGGTRPRLASTLGAMQMPAIYQQSQLSLS
jgi:hypothetical protein